MVMSEEKMRAEFEAWITSPPYEKPVTINPESSGWPGQYRAYEVQLAWEHGKHPAPRWRWSCRNPTRDIEIAVLMLWMPNWWLKP